MIGLRGMVIWERYDEVETEFRVFGKGKAAF